MWNRSVFLCLSLALTAFLVQNAESQETFRNPIFNGNSADPSVLRVGDFYYLTLSTNSTTEITIFKSSRLTNFTGAETTIAYVANSEQHSLWASEMHFVDGELYIYFTMNVEDDVGEREWRMHVIQAVDPTNPMGLWGSPIKLMSDFEPAIDGTVMKHGNGQNYFAWASTWGIWIARMDNATTIGASKLRLRIPVPTSPWECDIYGGCLNEGPYFIYNNNVSYLVYSASSTFLPDYALGLMSIPFDKDPMNPSNWDYGENAPVFWRNDDEDVYTTGHASFTVSPDGTETWMVYHATDSKEVINGNRVARIEKIDWSENGPVFPRPHGFNTDQPVPSGQILSLIHI